MTDHSFTTKEQTQYALCISGWILGCIIGFLLVPAAVSAAAQFGYSMHEFDPVGAVRFASIGTNVGRALPLIALAFLAFIVRNEHWAELKKIWSNRNGELKNVPAADFVLGIQQPLLASGVIGITCTILAYMARQGIGVRHLYIFAVAALGIGAMFLIATVGYAVLGPKVANSKKTGKKGKFPVRLMLVQGCGFATVLVLFAVAVAWLLFAIHLT